MIEIIRSFSRTWQVRQYEPENFFCSAKQTIEDNISEEEKQKISNELYQFCKNEVIKNIKQRVDELNQVTDNGEDLPF